MVKILTRMGVLMMFAVIRSPVCIAGSASNWSIDLGIQNVGTQELEKATVVWGEYRFPAGSVMPMKAAVYVDFDRPIPDVATVRYTTRNGEETSKTVVVMGAIPAEAYKDKDMNVTFNVNSSTYEVSVVFSHNVNRDDTCYDAPYEPDGDGVRIYDIRLTNSTDAALYAVLTFGDYRDGFYPAPAGVGWRNGLAPLMLGVPVLAEWREGESNAPIQKAEIPTAQYVATQKQIKSLHFDYAGNGKWTVTAYDSLFEGAQIVKP